LSGKLRKKDTMSGSLSVTVKPRKALSGKLLWLAPKWKLDNLTAIVDRNRLQNDACVVDVMPIEPLGDKWRALAGTLWKLTVTT